MVFFLHITMTATEANAIVINPLLRRPFGLDLRDDDVQAAACASPSYFGPDDGAPPFGHQGLPITACPAPTYFRDWEWTPPTPPRPRAAAAAETSPTEPTPSAEQTLAPSPSLSPTWIQLYGVDTKISTPQPFHFVDKALLVVKKEQDNKIVVVTTGFDVGKGSKEVNRRFARRRRAEKIKKIRAEIIEMARSMGMELKCSSCNHRGSKLRHR
jgi:hypothetical protein